MSRPKFTRKDSTSDVVVRDWLRAHCCHVVQSGTDVIVYAGGFVMGELLYAVDISNIGGWVDWLVWIGKPGRAVSCAWECKEPAKKKVFTEGEKVWRDEGPTLFSIIVNMDDCDRAAEHALAWLDTRRLETSEVEEGEGSDGSEGSV